MRARHLRLALVAGLLMACPATAQEDALVPEMPVMSEPDAPSDMQTRVIPQPGDEAMIPTSPVLTIDEQRVYLESAWGLRAQARLQAEGNLIVAENERLSQLLSSEEAELTEQRAELDAAEFRRLAENFDIRATEVRRERARAVQALENWADADRAAFFDAAQTLMGELMAERGAVVVLDQRTVRAWLEAIEITEPLIGRVNEALGDGDGVVPLPDQQQAPESTSP